MSAPLASERPRQIETVRLDWQGEPVCIEYDPNWLGMRATAHLQIRTDRAGAVLPITETGYRSHFLHPAHIEAAGGPAAYVLAWLDDAAQAPEWREHIERQRQGSLF